MITPISGQHVNTTHSAPLRRNSFRELFGGIALATPAAAVANVQAKEPTRSAAAENAHGPHTPPATPSALDVSWLTHSPNPVSLDPLKQALAQAGLDPGQFQFDQLEATSHFPTRPDLDYTTHQIAIRGSNKAGLFDRDLALRTPWVTAVELKTYGIA